MTEFVKNYKPSTPEERDALNAKAWAKTKQFIAENRIVRPPAHMRQKPPTPELLAETKAKQDKLPGNQLQKIITKRLGQEAIAGCGCKSMIGKMNNWGVNGCRIHLADISSRLETIATEKEWNLQPEEGEVVAKEDIGKPVPQTKRTKFLRLIARMISKTEVGKSLIYYKCEKMVLLAIRRSERLLQLDKNKKV
jgi:hypothetical protein